MKTFLADRLARYKIPRDYIFTQSLPRTPSRSDDCDAQENDAPVYAPRIVHIDDSGTRVQRRVGFMFDVARAPMKLG